MRTHDCLLGGKSFQGTWSCTQAGGTRSRVIACPYQYSLRGRDNLRREGSRHTRKVGAGHNINRERRLKSSYWKVAFDQKRSMIIIWWRGLSLWEGTWVCKKENSELAGRGLKWLTTYFDGSFKFEQNRLWNENFSRTMAKFSDFSFGELHWFSWAGATHLKEPVNNPVNVEVCH